MSTSVVACPACGIHVANDPKMAGLVVACPNCRSQFRLPAAAAPPAHPGPAASQPAPSSLPGSSGLTPLESLPTGLLPPSVETPRIAPVTPSSADETVPRRRKPRTAALPWGWVIGGVIGVLVIGVGALLFVNSQQSSQLDSARNRLIGNWKQDGNTSWQIVFHENSRLQMLTSPGGRPKLEEGTWRLGAVQGDSVRVLVKWADSNEELAVTFVGQDRLRLRTATGEVYQFSLVYQ